MRVSALVAPAASIVRRMSRRLTACCQAVMDERKLRLYLMPWNTNGLHAVPEADEQP